LTRCRGLIYFTYEIIELYYISISGLLIVVENALNHLSVNNWCEKGENCDYTRKLLRECFIEGDLKRYVYMYVTI